MPRGLKKVFITPLTTVDSADLEGVGTRRIEGDDEYIYGLGVASTIQGSVCTLSVAYATALVTTALGATPKRLGVAMAAIVAAKYGWYQVRGSAQAMVVASCVGGAALYTDTSNAGMVDDDASSEHAVHPFLLTTTVGGANALSGCLIHYPWTAPQLD